MAKKAKFVVHDVVVHESGVEGTVEEVSETSSGRGFQYRVRSDFTDRWVPEKSLELIERVESTDETEDNETEGGDESGDGGVLPPNMPVAPAATSDNETEGGDDE